MAKKNFLLLSLEDSKAKKVANIVSNDSCRKILDYLSEHETSTESELATELNIPISTIHYNLQQLKESYLIITEEFHYSKKGKEVSHYKLANKYIIITPKKVTGITEKLRSILPVGLAAIATAGIIQYASKYFPGKNSAASDTMLARAPAAMAEQAVGAGAPIMEKAIPAAQEIITNKAVSLLPNLTTNIAFWFLIGAVFALGIYLLISCIKKDKE
ncbi:MAG: helix-turn-helix domain-containing protein [Candidatus Woesearchaeota archaeon]|jgi:DNA-binding transcriptional ArsR family regulator|nr:helix-turn-helix domain-containing protein [Candidatus Woesearchaeota archaeon]|tara:strand:- start:2816 stop:3463 length:648 start_codon:yes stop_codon:yes gene_type:complete